MRFSWLGPIMLLCGLCLDVAAQEPKWIDLLAEEKFDLWKGPPGDWQFVGSVELDAKSPRMLAWKEGKGVIVNGPKGRANNLLTKQDFTDAEVHVEFVVPKGSNSGVKLMGLYEIQIFDSFGVKELTGADCGGIYPRAEEQPKYHHIDKGVPPKVNACKAPGEWQTLDIIFRAPRFDADGKKTSNAKFVKVMMNGQVIHEDVEVLYPTGAAWRLKKEIAAGPLMLQADHGPVAFRDVKVRRST